MEDVGGGDGAAGGDGGEGGEGGAEVFGGEIGGEGRGERGAGAAERRGGVDEGFVVAEIGDEGRIRVSDAGFDERLETISEGIEAESGLRGE